MTCDTGSSRVPSEANRLVFVLDTEIGHVVGGVLVPSPMPLQHPSSPYRQQHDTQMKDLQAPLWSWTMLARLRCKPPERTAAKSGHYYVGSTGHSQQFVSLKRGSRLGDVRECKRGPTVCQALLPGLVLSATNEAARAFELGEFVGSHMRVRQGQNIP